MKFDTLLAQYLYQHKKLNLPGIGSFEADASVTAPDENEKQKTSLEGIRYKNVPIRQADDDLIEFIKVHTGKMKPLAISDLESYLALGKQFLNIGKPFFLEGIGTLKLTREGKYEFTPGAYVATKLDDPNLERSENKASSIYEEDRLRNESNNNNLKKFLLAIGILGTLALVGWAGYYLYELNARNDNMEPVTDSTNAQDSLNNAALNDSLQKNNTLLADSASQPAANAGEYKFVIEKATRNRAFRRYQALRDDGSKVMMETEDSVTFKLYFRLAATPSDTTRIRDSLRRWYIIPGSKGRVTIEQ